MSFIKHDKNGMVSFGAGNFFVQGLIILCLFAFAIETLPDLTAGQRKALKAFELFSVIVFTIEYVLRLLFSRARRKYIFSFFGMVDLLAILPFYLAAGVDLRAVRAFRLLRLFQLLKLVRYSKAAAHYKRAFVIAREELILFGMSALIVLYLSAVGIYYFENPVQPEVFSSIFHSLWWATATLTTVGYGDIYPITVGGKAFTFLVLIVGLGVVAVPSGLIASALSRSKDEEETGE